MSNADDTRRAIAESLKNVIDPATGRDAVASGFARIAYCEGVAKITYELQPQAAGQDRQAALREQTEAVVGSVPGVQRVNVEFRIVERRATDVIPGVKHVIAVGAGKGGVGKSTVSVILAVGLQRRGLKVGLLDADVYGPSLPKLTGTEAAEPEIDEAGRVVPPEFGGIKMISMGHLVSPDQAVIWRGPMAQKYVKEFLDRGAWGELDYLLVDLPPGTGDIPLTLAQSIPLTGAVVVCTPQDVAVLDVLKAVRMYQKLGVEPLGMVENMSYYVCPHCAARDYPFGQGGAERAAAEIGVPFLGGIPLNIAIREFGDAGRPFAHFTDTAPEVVRALEQVVTNLVERVGALRRARTPLPQLKVQS
ncbi:MAG: Mrp/NBP35 family ATP-binding protein [Phycisphaerae bacterium]|nr:Mrp/NBP35 family ATP-binding protein [Phycisphaerae bacterium]